MFPQNRFNPLFPNAEKLHEDLQKASELDFVPKTSKELGSKLVLHQFVPAWDVQAYIRIAGMQLHVYNSKYPSYEATGELPQLNDGHFLLPREDIIMHLQTFHKDIDASLTDCQRAQSYAFRTMLSEKLHRVLLYCRWVDSVVFKELTRPLMKKAIPFPLNQVLPKKMRMDVTASLYQYGLQSKEQAYVMARDCYTALNTTLEASESDFFFGKDPTSLDAVVFGHIVDGLANPQLQKTIYQHAPALVTMAERLRDRYFGGEGPELLANDDMAYTQTHENVFATQDESYFMHKAAAAAHQIAFLKPYASLQWERRHVLSEVAATKQTEESQSHHHAPSSPFGQEDDKRFEKGPRNVIMGALVAIVVYTLAALPLRLQLDFDDDDDDDGEEEAHYEEEDDD